MRFEAQWWKILAIVDHEEVEKAELDFPAFEAAARAAGQAPVPGAGIAAEALIKFCRIYLELVKRLDLGCGVYLTLPTFLIPFPTAWSSWIPTSRPCGDVLGGGTAQPITRVTLQAADGHYVYDEPSGQRRMMAAADQENAWEIFQLRDVNAGVLLSGDQVTLQAHTSMFVCAEPDGRVVVDRDRPQAWETFVIGTPLGGYIPNGSSVWLRAHTGKYLCAEGGGGRELVANRDAPQAWEHFRLRFV